MGPEIFRANAILNWTFKQIVALLFLFQQRVAQSRSHSNESRIRSEHEPDEIDASGINESKVERREQFHFDQQKLIGGVSSIADEDEVVHVETVKHFLDFCSDPKRDFAPRLKKVAGNRAFVQGSHQKLNGDQRSSLRQRKVAHDFEHPRSEN